MAHAFAWSKTRFANDVITVHVREAMVEHDGVYAYLQVRA